VPSRGNWGSWYGRDQFLQRAWNTNQLFSPDLARYLGGDPTQPGNHYRVLACPAILKNDPTANPIQYAFWYGMKGYHRMVRFNDVPPRQGRIKRDDMDSASIGAGMVLPAGATPVKFLFACSNLTGTSGSIPIYWGFRNLQTFGVVHGRRNAAGGGNYMNVMTLDGGTILVRNTPGLVPTGQPD